MAKKAAEKKRSKKIFGIHLFIFFLILFFGSSLIHIWPTPIFIIGLLLVDVIYLLCVLLFSKMNFSLHFCPSREWLIVLFLATFAMGFSAYCMITEDVSLKDFLERFSHRRRIYPAVIPFFWTLAFSMCFKIKWINKDKQDR